MIFTGKAKEQFENWYNNQTWNDDYLDNDVYCFYLLHESMQWGVIQAFADSELLDLDAVRYGVKYLSELLDSQATTLSESNSFNTRPEARAEAIKQLNEYLNKTL